MTQLYSNFDCQILKGKWVAPDDTCFGRTPMDVCKGAQSLVEGERSVVSR